jgi:hypothetical protein
MNWVIQIYLFDTNKQYHEESKLLPSMTWWLSSALDKQPTGRHVASLGHIIPIPGQLSLLLLVNVVCLSEKE